MYHYVSNYLDMCIDLKTHFPKEARVITLITAQCSNWTPKMIWICATILKQKTKYVTATQVSFVRK